MTLDELILYLQRIKEQNGFDGDTTVICYDIWEDKTYDIKEVEVNEDIEGVVIRI